MNFVADENIPRQIIDWLRANGHSVTAVGEVAPRAIDEWILGQAAALGAILLTNDKDFGELIFRLGKGSGGVVLLRLEGLSTAAKVAAVAASLDHSGDQMRQNFSVIAPGRMRVRKREP